MASAYSSLKFELIGTGEQTGTWGTTTNTNIGTAINEAITGSADVVFADDTYILTLEDVPTTQIARNLRLNLIGLITSTTALIVPSIEKFYIINNTLDHDVVVGNSTGLGTTVPAGASMFVFNTGANVYDAFNYVSTLYLGVPLAVGSGGTGVTTSTGTGSVVLNTSPTLVTPNLGTPASGTLTSCTGLPLTSAVTGILPVANGGTNSSNAVVEGGVVYGNATSMTYTLVGTSGQILKSNGASAPSWIAAPGTIYTQNANAVAITGGTVTGITDLAVADGGTGSSTLAANNVLLGNGTSALQVVAPGTSGNVLTSNGTTWTSASKLTSGTVTPTTSGTSVTIGSIPSWVKRITFQLIGVSWTTSGTAPMIQLGTSGGIVTTGYSSAGQLGNTNVNATNTGLVFSATDSGSATRFWWGTGVLTLADAATNSWTWTVSVSETLTGVGVSGGGAGGIALGAGNTLSQIKFFTLGGADTFDAGSVNILYE